MGEALRPVTISLIVATFGESRWRRLARRRAVPSVCAQTVQPLELLVHHGETLHGARNDAAAGAHGDWLGFLDADDELAPHYLEAMAAAIRGCHDATCPCQDGDTCHYQDDPVTGALAFPRLLIPAVAYVRGPGDELPARILDPGRPLEEVNRCVIGTLVPRRLFDEVGGFRDWLLYEDWDLWLSCVERGAHLVDVPGAVYRAWERPASRNRAPRRQQQATYDAIRAAHGLVG